MPYKLVVPPGYRRRGGAAPPELEGARHAACARRMRILEVLKLQCNDGSTRVPGPEARRRVVEVLRLQAGLPVASSDAPLPRGRPEPIDISALENDWENGRRKYLRALAEFGLAEDMYGRLHCAACGDFVPASTRGLHGGSTKALSLWHRSFCVAREEKPGTT